MKKTYQAPALIVMNVQNSLPIATSLTINNDSQNNVQGDVKGDWGDIWDEPAIDEE